MKLNERQEKLLTDLGRRAAATLPDTDPTDMYDNDHLPPHVTKHIHMYITLARTHPDLNFLSAKYLTTRIIDHIRVAHGFVAQF